MEEKEPTKRCGRCTVDKPIEEFTWYSTNGKRRRQSYCQNCRTAYRQEHPELSRQAGRKYYHAHVEEQRRQRLLCRYHVTQTDFEQLLLHQGGVCAICHIAPNDNIFCVDHDHNCCPDKNHCCGKCIRGLLCRGCNFIVGWFERTGGKVTLQVLETYLQKEYIPREGGEK